MTAWTCVRVISAHGTSPCPSPSWWTLPHIALVAAVAAFALLLGTASVRRRHRGEAMSPADRAAWRSARTLADLGRLGARWLEGGLSSQPSYGPGVGPAPETASLVPPLASLNRAGFYTIASSPAFDGTAPGGVHWQQRAAVEGFASEAIALRVLFAAEGAGLAVIAHGPATLPRKGYRSDREMAVTLEDGEEYTWFGQELSPREIRSRRVGWGILRRPALRALCSAWQLTVIDPQWGREDLLWDVLGSAVTAGCPYESCHHNHPELPERNGGAR